MSTGQVNAIAQMEKFLGAGVPVTRRSAADASSNCQLTPIARAIS